MRRMVRSISVIRFMEVWHSMVISFNWSQNSGSTVIDVRCPRRARSGNGLFGRRMPRSGAAMTVVRLRSGCGRDPHGVAWMHPSG
jgi:hypothetical protein